MKYFQKRISLLILIVAIILTAGFAMAGAAKAQSSGDLKVTFQSKPLFNETNFLPGDSEIHWVSVKNDSADTTYDLGVKSDNPVDWGNLSSQFNLKIQTSGGQTYYDNSLSDFFRGNVIDLGSIGPDEEKYYYFQAHFNEAAGNEYQLATLNFDIIIGTTGAKKSSGGGGSGGGGGFLPCWFTGTCGGSSQNKKETPAVAGEEGVPNLVVEKTAGVQFTNPGSKVPYKIIVKNNGNLTAFNVILNDQLPEGLVFKTDNSLVRTWRIGDLEAGESYEVNYEVLVLSQTDPGIYTNTAIARADNNPMVETQANLEVRPIIVKGIESEELTPTGFSFRDLAWLIILFIMFTVSGWQLKRLVKEFN
jgi:uncharacterized repeat protein (TIGR01451 family)